MNDIFGVRNFILTSRRGGDYLISFDFIMLHFLSVGEAFYPKTSQFKVIHNVLLSSDGDGWILLAALDGSDR